MRQPVDCLLASAMLSALISHLTMSLFTLLPIIPDVVV
jgi:hypothetical protein